MLGFWSRFLFAIKHKTLRRMVQCASQPAYVAVYHKGRETKLKRRCPHQGGPLEKGKIEGDDLICPWHGCRFSLTATHPVQPYAPTFSKDEVYHQAPSDHRVSI